MGDETIILEFSIDERAVVLGLERVTEQMTKLKIQQKTLASQFKKGEISAEKYAKETTQITLELKHLQAEQRKATKILKLYDKAVINNTNNLDSLTAQIELEEIALAELTNTYEIAEDGTVKLSDAFLEQAEKIKVLRNAQVQLKNATGKTRLESLTLREEITKGIDQSGLMPGIIGQISAGFKTLGGVLGGVTKRFGALRAAIISTGIGALVVALAALFLFFTKSSSGALKLKQAMGGIEAVFNVITKVAVQFGEVLFKALENPKQALLDLAAFIKNNLINRLKGLGEIFFGLFTLDFKRFANGFVQVGTGITDATDKAVKFGNEVAAQNKLIQEQILLEAKVARQIGKNNLLVAKAVLLQERLKNVRDNELNSLGKRIAANEKLKKQLDVELVSKLKSIELERQILANQINILRSSAQTLDVKSKELELNKKLQERAEVIADFEGKVNEQITNRVGLIREVADADLELAEAIAEKKLVFLRVGTAQELAIKKQLIEATLRAELAGIGNESRLRNAAIIRANAARLQAEKDRAQAVLETNINVINQQIERAKEGTTKRLGFEIEKLKQELVLEQKFGTLIGQAKLDFEKTTIFKIQKLRDENFKAQIQTAIDAARNQTEAALTVANLEIEERTRLSFKLLEIEKQTALLAVQNTANQKSAELLILAQFGERKKLLEQQLTQEALNQELLDIEARKALALEDSDARLQAEVDAELKKAEILLATENLTAVQREAIVKTSEDKITKIRLDAELKRFDGKVKLQNEYLSIFGDITTALINIANKESKEAQILARIQQGIAIASIVFNTERSISRILLKNAAIPGGFLKSGLEIGGVVAKGLAALSAVKSVKLAKGGHVGTEAKRQGVSKLAGGGFVRGAGTGTSDSIPAQLSNGEFIVNAAATAQNLPALQAINAGLITQTSTPQQPVTSVANVNEQAIIVEVSEINRVQQKVQVIENSTDF